MKAYTGIGSMECPLNILDEMQSIALRLSSSRILRSTGTGCKSFENGCKQGSGALEMFIPWKGFNGYEANIYYISRKAAEYAKRTHPYWDALQAGNKKVQACNVQRILGRELNDPVEFVICWTDRGRKNGVVGHYIRPARVAGIPILDLGSSTGVEEVSDFLSQFGV